ncbi:uncharacterized protein A4U43_UnF11560 [Asparagus officinalis]|uniref:Uncharacterized protein n=1 Tax=Asparagus officinalis TaxID=4686 RepID=A0A1R3L594_ASPOF|nr:uncharacterized protein A4U43_UnF11560 [Asparagus officinalis]
MKPVSETSKSSQLHPFSLLQRFLRACARWFASWDHDQQETGKEPPSSQTVPRGVVIQSRSVVIQSRRPHKKKPDQGKGPEINSISS